jgi:methionyl-tRNA formyltransferase
MSNDNTAPVRFILVTGHTFGRRALEGILSSDDSLKGNLECSLIIGLSESRKGATSGYFPISELADEWSIPFCNTEDGSLSTHETQIRDLRPHYILVIGWSRLVAASILDIPKQLFGYDKAPRNTKGYGCIGMHPTKLPFGRGQAPIPGTILRGLKTSALSTFFLEDAVDAGEILAQDELDIRPRETGGSLFLNFADLHYHAAKRLAGFMAKRSIQSQPQNTSAATVWPKRRPTDSAIDPNQTMDEVDKLVRAVAGPYPHAYIETIGLNIRFVNCKKTSRRDLEPRVLGSVQGRYLSLGVSDGVVDLLVDRRDLPLLKKLKVGSRI